MNLSSPVHTSLAKRLRKSSRAARDVAAILLGISAASLYLWGPGWNVWIPLGMGVWEVVSWITESRSARSHEEQVRSGTAKLDRPAPTSDSEFKLVADEDDTLYERRISFEGKQVRIQISDRAPVYEHCRPHADFLVAHLDQLAVAFDAFKRAQAEGQPEWAEGILALEIENICFFSHKRPNVAEVFFSEESGGEYWRCLLDGLQFKDLSEQN